MRWVRLTPSVLAALDRHENQLALCCHAETVLPALSPLVRSRSCGWAASKSANGGAAEGTQHHASPSTVAVAAECAAAGSAQLTDAEQQRVLASMAVHIWGETMPVHELREQVRADAWPHVVDMLQEVIAECGPDFAQRIVVKLC